MFFLKMAARNVLRQYGRTALSMVSIVMGVAVIILGRGFTGGIRENVIRAQIDTMSGHVLAVPDGYPTTGIQNPVDKLLTLEPSVRDWLDKNTVVWTSRTIFVPQLIKGPDAMRVRAYGFDPVMDEKVFPRTQWRVNGTIPQAAADGILVSSGVASVFSLTPGVEVVMTARTTAGAINALNVRVSGILSTGNPQIDGLGIFVPRHLVQELIQNGDAFSHLALLLKNRDLADSMVEPVAQQFKGAARVRTWYQEAQGVIEAQDLRQVFLDIVALALVAIAATGIANTILMAAYERVREIGTLRAMGMTRRGVIMLFVGEGLFMGVLGSLLGAGLGGGLVYHYSIHGIDLTSMMYKEGARGSYANVPFSSMLYTHFSSSTVVSAALFGIVLAAVSAVYPAFLASKRPPADAVRAE